MRILAALLMLFLLPGPAPARGPAAGRHAMVATEQRYATQAGVDVLRAGGNAVDAAVAVAYALAVVDPCCGNVGGGGFMLVRMHDGRERFIDFREKAPRRATRDMFLDSAGKVDSERSRKGWLAVGVPGTVLGMETARKEYGTMSRAALMAPAIALARDGFTFSQGDLVPFAGTGSGSYDQAYSFASQANVRAIFMPRGRFPRAGEMVKQPELAKTLELVARGGAPAFYDGPVARDIVAASDANGGILSMADFRHYAVGEGAPLHCSFRSYELASAPPPSSGGVTLCEILNVIAPYPLASWGWHSVRSLHYLTEAERRAYADRNTYLGDPNFVADPISQLLSPAYAAKLRAQIDPNRATPSVDVKPGLGAVAHENGDTSHYSIVDAAGNAVAVTYTLNNWFGAGVIAGSTGFFLNDEMDDFTAKPGVPNMYGLVQGARNDIAPAKRPLSTMAPTILTLDGKLAMVTGSPGGGRIITTVLETILNTLVYGMAAQPAVDAPRTHMQWLPDELEYEPGAFTPQTARRLEAMGYRLREISSWGSAQVVVIDPKTGILYGGTDRNRPSGLALGY